MFKNVMMYRLAKPWDSSAAAIQKMARMLEIQKFQPCAATEEVSVGWVEPRGVAHGPLAEVVAGQLIFKLMVETKTVPASEIKRLAQKQIEKIVASGRKPGRLEVREIKDDVRVRLLPTAVSRQRCVMCWIDPAAGLLVLDSSSATVSMYALVHLERVIHGFSVKMIHTTSQPPAAMAHWLAEKEAPPGFSVDRECELKATDESKAVVRYTRHPLDTDEVCEHIAKGKLPTRLALTWNDRVSFVLTEGLQLKKVAVLDVVLEAAASLASDGKDDNFDADVAIATGELQNLIPDLIAALGGEPSNDA